ncbi:MAG TPA: AlpA family phage regulatory protein [Thermohalobaculum sp.]|nr:AlpA family phage regulatory protein [Thermohalobaculum sp.]
MGNRSDRMIRIGAVCDITGESKSTTYRRIADDDDDFPPPYHFGAAARWSENEVRAWVARKMREQRGERPLTLLLDNLPEDVREAFGRLLDAWSSDDLAELERAWQEFRAAKLASIGEDAASEPVDVPSAAGPADAGAAAWLGRGRP